jgi:hypothetical protein
LYHGTGVYENGVEHIGVAILIAQGQDPKLAGAISEVREQ